MRDRGQIKREVKEERERERKKGGIKGKKYQERDMGKVTLFPALVETVPLCSVVLIQL